MDVSQAKALRLAWNSKGDPPCPHNRLDAESTESGYFTGQYVCKTCGDYVEVHNQVSGSDPQGVTHPRRGRYVFYTSIGLLATAVPVLTMWYKRNRRGNTSR